MSRGPVHAAPSATGRAAFGDRSNEAAHSGQPTRHPLHGAPGEARRCGRVSSMAQRSPSAWTTTTGGAESMRRGQWQRAGSPR